MRRTLAAWLLLGLFGMLATLGTTGTADAQAAVVVGGRGNDNIYWQYNHQTIGEARQAAMAACQREHGDTCRVATTFVRQCFALARPQSRQGHGWAWRQDQREAGRVAIRECEQRNNVECFVENQFCDGQ